MSLLQKALDIVHKATADPMPTKEDRELVELRAQLSTLERINGEYFACITQMEKERNQWKEMFFVQSGEHQTGQSMLQKIIAECATNLRAAIVQLNFFRRGAGLPEVSEPKMLSELPTDLPEQYGKRMKELAESAMPQTDGKARRAEIAASREPAP